MDNYRNTSEYREWQKKVKERDGGRCRACLSKHYLETHHIFRVQSHPHLSDHEDNGITLCKQCHVKLSKKENNVEFLFQIVTDPLTKQLERLTQTNRSIERIIEKNKKEAKREQPSIADLGPIYDEIEDFSDGLAKYKDFERDKYGFIDKKGRIIIQANYFIVHHFSEGLAGFTFGTEDLEDKWGYINQQGKTVIYPQFEQVGDFRNGLSRVAILGGYGDGSQSHFVYIYIDKTGQQVDLDPEELSIRSSGLDHDEPEDNFSEGLSPFRDPDTDKYGFHNEMKEIIIEAKYDEVNPFSDGLARYFDANKGKYGFIKNPLTE